MKTIGLLGGMSWESTGLYYQQINRGIQRELGSLNSAQIILNSINFAQIEILQKQGKWKEASDFLTREAIKLQNVGVDGIALCTNTMHICAPEIIDELNVPFLHIADATAQAVLQKNIRHIALLGTRFTMEQNFYKYQLQSHDIKVTIPQVEDRKFVHKVIYEELCCGQIHESSRLQFIEIIRKLKNEGIQGVVLGCTEIGMLLPDENILNIPLFDTTKAHVNQIIQFMLD